MEQRRNSLLKRVLMELKKNLSDSEIKLRLSTGLDTHVPLDYFTWTNTSFTPHMHGSHKVSNENKKCNVSVSVEHILFEKHYTYSFIPFAWVWLYQLIGIMKSHFGAQFLYLEVLHQVWPIMNDEQVDQWCHREGRLSNHHSNDYKKDAQGVSLLCIRWEHTRHLAC